MSAILKIETLIKRANTMLLHSPDDYKDDREGIISFLTYVLHDTRNYKGFISLTQDDMKNSENGLTPGVVYDEINKKNITLDPTRVMFLK